MQFTELKEALQSTVSVDLEELYTVFVQERGSGDLVAFVTDLYRQEHITQEVLHKLVSEGTLDAELVGTLAGQNEEEATEGANAPPVADTPAEEEVSAAAEETAAADDEPSVQQEIEQSLAISTQSTAPDDDEASLVGGIKKPPP